MDLSTYRPQPEPWLWPHRFKLGGLSLVAGVQGLGKSTVLSDMAARISRGRPWPDLPQDGNPVGATLLLVREEDHDDICARLIAADADMTKVVLVEGLQRGKDRQDLYITDETLNLLERKVRETGARMVVLDPFVDFTDEDVGENSNKDVRAVGLMVREFAKRAGVACVGTAHLRKGVADNAVHKVLGSSGLTSVPRAVWLIHAPNGQNDDLRAMLCAKRNFRVAAGLEFRITNHTLDNGREAPLIEWLGESGEDADEAIQPLVAQEERVRGVRRQQAAEFLKRVLADGPLPATVVCDLAKKEGISIKTLNRAKTQLRIACGPERVGQPSQWMWPCG